MKINYITEDAEALKAINELDKFSKLCADTETPGLQATVSKCRLVQLCDASPAVEDRTIHVIDIFKTSVLDELKILIESRELLLGHNLGFDLQFFYSLGIDYKNKIFDTYIAERVLRAGFQEKKYSPKSNKPYFADVSCSLKAVAERRLEIELDKEQRKTDWSAETLTLDQVEYAATDVDILPKIAAEQLKELNEEALIGVYSIESKCIRPVAKMSYTGFNVNTERLHKLKVSLETQLNEKTTEFVEALDAKLPAENKLPRTVDGAVAVGKKANKEFNPGSTTQVAKAFDLCGIALPQNEETGKSTLNQISLAEFDSKDAVLLLYRERVKIETSLEHAEKLIQNINPVTHRIHSFYNQVGANSGRFTCAGAPKTAKTKTKTTFAVNLQQVPRSKLFREAFVASPGYKLIIADYSQMELRLLAELANIPQMQEAYNTDIDLHTLTASLVNDCDISDVTKQQRQMAKGANFGFIYGIGFRKFKTYAAASFGVQLSLSESKILHSKFHSAYPRLREWHRQRGALVQDGWCYTRTALGRRRLLSYDDARMTIAANTLIQGTGADILKVALGELNDHLNNDVRLIAVVHDECVLEVREGLENFWKDKLAEIMVNAGASVFEKTRLVAEPGIGDDWSAK
jgi:DNA polymerase I-like protein with 3'-5' exonuclease and polymerase domains